MIRVEPDLIRFCDPEAMSNKYLIHTVELSDERSVRQFITLWFKGKAELPQIEQWKKERGLDGHHQRDIYHRGPAWLPSQYPDKQKRGWSHHTHVDLPHSPSLSDLEPFADQIPPAVLAEIQSYL